MKYFALIIIIVILLSFKPLKLEEIEKLVDREISVEVKGHLENPGIFKIENYSTINELLAQLKLFQDSDYSHLNLNQQVYNKQVITFNKKTKDLKISINSANVDQLTTLKGIGETIALRIIEYRNNNGGFRSIEELKNVKGIGEKVFLKIKDFIIL